MPGAMVMMVVLLVVMMVMGMKRPLVGVKGDLSSMLACSVGKRVGAFSEGDCG